MVAFYARRPELKLNLDDDAAVLSESLQRRYEKRVANDALYLPKSTNMGLPAYMSTGEKYNYEDADEGVAKVKVDAPKRTAAFKRSIPCFFVSHVPSILPWYKEVLGFSVVGKAEAGRAELHRGAPETSPTKRRSSDTDAVGGVSLYLRRPADPDSRPPMSSLWIEVDDVDAFHQEMLFKLSKYAQDLTDYFPKHHLGSGKITAKPRNNGLGERSMTVVDDAGNSIFFFQVLNQ